MTMVIERLWWLVLVGVESLVECCGASMGMVFLDVLRNPYLFGTNAGVVVLHEGR
jgi:hypothetical protein